MTRERGSITLWVLGLCIALLFLGGLSLDLWRAAADRHQLAVMADAAATAAANGVDEQQLRAGHLTLDPARARQLALTTLAEYPHARALDELAVVVHGNTVTVTLRDHVAFSLLGVFMAGQRFDVTVHAAAAPQERP
jgi:Flp pilus assembly protein TadG